MLHPVRACTLQADAAAAQQAQEIALLREALADSEARHTARDEQSSAQEVLHIILLLCALHRSMCIHT
jgi:hypothetical protein